MKVLPNNRKVQKLTKTTKIVRNITKTKTLKKEHYMYCNVPLAHRVNVSHSKSYRHPLGLYHWDY